MPKKAAPKFTKEGIRAFLDRPWHLVEAAKADYWAQAHAADATATVRASQSMWSLLRGRSVVANEAERDRDFQDHLKQREFWDRVNRGCAR
jgi:hypothetical protein